MPHAPSLFSTDSFIRSLFFCFVLWSTEFNLDHQCVPEFGDIHWSLVGYKWFITTALLPVAISLNPFITALWALHRCMIDLLGNLVQVLYRPPKLLWDHDCNGCVMPRRYHFSFLHIFHLSHSSVPSFQCFLPERGWYKCLGFEYAVNCHFCSAPWAVVSDCVHHHSLQSKASWIKAGSRTSLGIWT